MSVRWNLVVIIKGLLFKNNIKLMLYRMQLMWAKRCQILYERNGKFHTRSATIFMILRIRMKSLCIIKIQNSYGCWASFNMIRKLENNKTFIHLTLDNLAVFLYFFVCVSLFPFLKIQNSIHFHRLLSSFSVFLW